MKNIGNTYGITEKLYLILPKTRTMKGTNYISLILIFIAFGCSSNQDLLKTWEPETKFYKDCNLNGKYLNNRNSGDSKNLWTILTSANSFKESKLVLPVASWTQLELLNDSILKATLVIKDSVIDSILLRGKVDETYFSVIQNNKLIPLPPFYWRKRNYKLLIGTNGNNNLLITSLEVNEGYIFLVGASGGGTNSYSFERRKN